MKHAALQWNKQLHKSLLEIGFLRCKSDPGTYFKIISENLIILLVYVDNAFLWVVTRHKSLLINLSLLQLTQVGPNVAQARLLRQRKNLKEVGGVHSEIGLRLMYGTRLNEELGQDKEDSLTQMKQFHSSTRKVQGKHLSGGTLGRSRLKNRIRETEV